MAERNFTIDRDRLAEICVRAYEAYVNNGGVFREGIKKYLPQWNLPVELEYDPIRTEVREPLMAAQYLFLLVSLERRSLSSVNIRNGLRTWNTPEERWIFNPLEVAIRDPSETEEVITRSLQYTLNDFSRNYRENCIKLVREYDMDPRKIIGGKVFEQAKSELMTFKGIGTGISNLAIIYFVDRKLATVTDSEDCEMKVDIHKSRIPVNTNCVTTDEDAIRSDNVSQELEIAYREILKEQGLDALTLDGVLWVIGSEICARKNYRKCVSMCPLEEMCSAYTPEVREARGFLIYTKEGGKRVRVDPRQGIGQVSFPFFRSFKQDCTPQQDRTSLLKP
jgi:hypothetical protein